MNYFLIKVFALFFMTIDHLGVGLLNNNIIMRSIGRIAFPLFCFGIVNGFYHTKDKKQYLLRVGIFSLISEIPFNLFVSNKLFYFSYQNVYFVLFLGLLLIIILNNLKNKVNLFLYLLSNLFLVVLFCFISTIFKIDYYWFGIILIWTIYLFYNKDFIKNKLCISLAICFLTIIFCIIEKTFFELPAVLSIVFILLFKDKKMVINKYVKIFCYIYYPLHLFILYLLRLYICM